MEFEPDNSIRQLQAELIAANEEIADLNDRLEVACDELARNRNRRQLAEDEIADLAQKNHEAIEALAHVTDLYDGERSRRQLAEDGLTQVMEIVGIYAKGDPNITALQADLYDELGK